MNHGSFSFSQEEETYQAKFRTQKLFNPQNGMLEASSASEHDSVWRWGL